MKGPINQHKALASGQNPDVRRPGPPSPRPTAFKKGGMVKGTGKK